MIEAMLKHLADEGLQIGGMILLAIILYDERALERLEKDGLRRLMLVQARGRRGLGAKSPTPARSGECPRRRVGRPAPRPDGESSLQGGGGPSRRAPLTQKQDQSPPHSLPPMHYTFRRESKLGQRSPARRTCEPWKAPPPSGRSRGYGLAGDAPDELVRSGNCGGTAAPCLF